MPADRLEAIVASLPCMREPTVARLHGDRGYAVKVAVLREQLAEDHPRGETPGRDRHRRQQARADRAVMGAAAMAKTDNRSAITAGPGLVDVQPYSTPAFSRPVDLKLDGNEGLQPDPRVLEALARLGPDVLRRYPMPVHSRNCWRSDGI